MVDPTTQTTIPPAEPIGTAPKPEPIVENAGGDGRQMVDPMANMDPSKIGQHQPAPQPAEQPAAQPAAAPVAEPPGWIREAGKSAPQDGAAIPPTPAQPPVNYHDLPKVDMPQGTDPQDLALNAIVTNPRGFIGGLVHEALDQRVNPAFAAMSQTAGAVNNYIGARSKVEIDRAKQNVEALYTNVFQQDEAYNSNPAVKRDVDAAMKNMLETGIQETKYGEFETILTLGSYTPIQAKAALSAVKVLHGVPGSPVSSPNVGSAVVEHSTSATPLTHDDVYITPEEEQIIAFRERIDPNFRSEFVAAKREAIRRGDWEF